MDVVVAPVADRNTGTVWLGKPKARDTCAKKAALSAISADHEEALHQLSYLSLVTGHSPDQFPMSSPLSDKIDG
jgi:hypothetical protein